MDIFDFKCKYCGGNLENIDGRHSIATCKYCGRKQTLPKLPDQKRVDLFGRANHLRRNYEFDKADLLYEQILTDDPHDPEAYWSLVLCRFGVVYVEDIKTGDRIPTVNRTQRTSIFGDENYLSALEFADEEQHAIYEHDAGVINEIQRGILEISQNEQPFDVFICYKETDDRTGKRSQDSALAYDLYRELTRDGYKVFFARETLKGKLGTAYEPYIFSALTTAKVMVVLGTKKEHFEAVWVRNEWSRFLGQIKAGEKKALIPVYRDMDAYDLPQEFANLQALDMNHVGYLQELIAGVENIVKIYRHDEESDDGHAAPAPVEPPKKKKYPLVIFAIAFVLALAVGLGAFVVLNQSGGPGGNTVDTTGANFSYTTNNDGTLTITGYHGTAHTIMIPETIGGKTVTAVGAKAFDSMENLTSVTLPATITSIGANAFYGCTSIATITVPDSVETMGVSVFYGWSGEQTIVLNGRRSIPPQWNDRWNATSNAKIVYSVKKITFDANAGTGRMDDAYAEMNQVTTLPVCTFTRDGFTFLGWSQTVDGEVVATNMGEFAMGNEDVCTLYAVWSPNENTLSFDSNGGTGVMADLIIATGVTAQLPTAVFEKDGWMFAGWSTQKDGEVIYADEASYQMGSDATYTLYAVWEVFGYPITYNLSGGQNSAANPKKIPIGADTITLAAPTRGGYTFKGWYADPDYGQAVTVIEKGTQTGVSLWAKWEANTYTLTLNTNGGAETYEDLSVTYDAPYTLPTPTRIGYIFSGWYNGETQYTGSQWTDTSNVRLSAKWTPKADIAYTVNHYLENLEDDGYILEKTEYFTGTAGASVTPAIGTYEGFVKPSQKTVSIAGDGTTVVNYHYKRKTISVSLVENGGNEMADAAWKCGSSAPLNVPAPTREGYTFGGWYTDAVLTNALPSEYFPSTNAKLYAHWKEENKPSDFEYSGKEKIAISGYKGTASQVCIPAYIGGVPVTEIGMYAFRFDQLTSVILPAGLTSIKFQAFCSSGIQSITIPASLTSIGIEAFAHNPNLQSITVEAGNPVYHSTGNCLMETATGTLMAACNTSVIPADGSVVSIADYAFSGLSKLTSVTIPDGVKSIGEYVFRGCVKLTNITIPVSVTNMGQSAFQNWTNAQTIILSGRTSIPAGWDGSWDADCSAKVVYGQKTITFHANGGVGNMASVGAEMNQDTTLPACTFNRAGYSFAGWSTTLGGAVVAADRDTFRLSQDANCTLYAVWTPNTNTLIFDPNGGTGEMAPIRIPSNQSATLPANTFEKEGNSFVGWSIDKSNNISYVDEAKYTMGTGESYTLYAVWGERVYKITYNLDGGQNHPSNPKTYEKTSDPITLHVPTRRGYTFVGWYTDADCKNAVTFIDTGKLEDVTLWAKWEPKTFTITLDSNGGAETYEALGVAYDAAYTLPTPTRVGYIFSGWYSGKTLYTNGIWTSTSNLRLTAKWTARSDIAYTVNHYLENLEDDGYILDKTEYFTGTAGASVRPATEIYEGFVTPGTQTVTIAADGTTVIDYYYKRIFFTVSLIENGGDAMADVDWKCDAWTPATIPTPTREGYTFGGWYTDETLTNEQSNEFYPEADMTLYAYWAEENKPSDFTYTGGTIQKYTGSGTEVCIPAYIGGVPVTVIGANAFHQKSTLTSVIIPESVKSIDDWAFGYCSKLTSVNIPAGVTSIGDWAFYFCDALTSVYITDIAAWCSINFEDDDANPLYYAHNLYLNGVLVTDLVIPTDVTSIGDYAFCNCTSLTGITLPTGLTSIGSAAFAGCSKLADTLTVPAGVTNIDSNTFSGCSGLTGIEVAAGNPKYHASGNCLIDTATKTLVMGCANSVIPADGSVTIIGKSAFRNFRSLTTLIIPEGVTTIEQYAFSFSSLKSIAIPASVTHIGQFAFQQCHSLSDLYITDIQAWLNINFAENESYPLASASKGNLYLNNQLVTQLVIPDGVTSISDQAFRKCSSIETVVIPDSVISIGSCAFFQCDGLRSIEIPANVKNIGYRAFEQCRRLAKITLSDGIETIDESAFSHCSELSVITLPKSITSIGDSVFSVSSKLTSVIYEGTMAEWNAIPKGEMWDPWTPAYTIHCIDGDITKE